MEVWYIVLMLHGAPVSVLSPVQTKAECEDLRSYLVERSKGTKPDFGMHCVKGEKST